ncbi:MAG: GtrA family protein [Candidatus Saccharimonadales bacterium]
MRKQEEGEVSGVLSQRPNIKQQPIRWSWHLLGEVCRLAPSHRASVQFIRSLVVSVIALIVDFGLLVILKESAGMHYLLAATLSFGAGVVVNYLLSVKWVFAQRKLASRRKEFVIFTVICAIGLGLNLAIIAGFVQLFHFDYRVAKAISTVIVFFWNFLARKKILY